MNAALNALLTALMLLTRLPVARWCRHSPEAVAASVAFFPLVGLLVGALAALCLRLAYPALSIPCAVLLSMLATVLLTGAIHEDGLADAADGLFGGLSPAQRMEIMKDSRIGSYGVLALCFALSLKGLLLTDLFKSSFSFAWRSTLIAHCLGRAAAVAVMHSLPHVGIDARKAKPFCERLPKPTLLATLLAPALACAVLLPGLAVPVLAASTLSVFACTGLFREKLGGITGDCLGASIVFTELTVLGVCAASV